MTGNESGSGEGNTGIQAIQSNGTVNGPDAKQGLTITTTQVKEQVKKLREEIEKAPPGGTISRMSIVGSSKAPAEN